MTCGQVWWPILRICALHLTHPNCTHTAVEHTHTVNTHPEQWAAIYAAAPGEQLGVRCLAQGHLSLGIEGGRECCTFTPPTYNLCRTWDSNSQPLGYESNSLTIRPRLPHITYPSCHFISLTFFHGITKKISNFSFNVLWRNKCYVVLIQHDVKLNITEIVG